MVENTKKLRGVDEGRLIARDISLEPDHMSQLSLSLVLTFHVSRVRP